MKALGLIIAAAAAKERARRMGIAWSCGVATTTEWHNARALMRLSADAVLRISIWNASRVGVC